MLFSSSPVSRRALVLIALASALPALLGACGKRRGQSSEVWVETPVLALENLPAGALYYNGPAREVLRRFHPERLAPGDTSAESEQAGSFAQATQEPKLFRQLDRQHRFTTVWLLGDPSQYRPLLQHLLETPDWKLAYLDHTSLLFRRPLAEPWTVAQVTPLTERAARLDDSARARVLAELAGRLVAVREAGEAKKLLEQAQKADRNLPEVWSAQANFRMAQGDWTGAIDAARQALNLDAKNLPALGCLAQSLYASKCFGEAFGVSNQLLALRPGDPGLLFYHAKIAHEAKEYEAEIQALRPLIALAEKAGRSVSGYRVYLGQALGHSGEREQALQEFALALSDAQLPEEQRKFAEECVDRLRDVPTLPTSPAAR